MTFDGAGSTQEQISLSSLDFMFAYLLVLFPGLLLSLLFLCNVRPTNERFNCCCCCCCCSCKAAIEYGIYKPDRPTKHFILRINADGSEVILPADDQERQPDQEDELKELKEQEQDRTQETGEEELGQEKEQGTEEGQDEEEVEEVEEEQEEEELEHGQVELMEEGHLELLESMSSSKRNY